MRRDFVLMLPAALLIGGLALGGQTPGPPQPARSPSVVISEVRFDPRQGEAAFIELLNTAPKPIAMDRMAIRLDDGLIPLARVITPLPAGGRLVIWFDGLGRTEGLAHHAAQSLRLNPDGGSVQLIDERDKRLDAVAWGNADGSVDRHDDDLIGLESLEGRTIGRPPGANQPVYRGEWVVYAAGRATPGAANPMPPVQDLLPGTGEIVRQPGVALLWYPVTGARQYRVQLAGDENFSAPLLDRTVTTTTIPSQTLAPGTYFWRVQAVASDGTTSEFSKANRFRVAGSAGIHSAVAGVALKLRSSPGSWRSMDDQSLNLARPSRVLPVPILSQHKDTRMLQLENTKERDPHGWDQDHQDYDRNDPADSHNCVVATTAMINHFKGGDLNQDRIAYEVRSDRAALYAGRINSAPSRAGLPSSGMWAPAGVTNGLRDMHAGPEMDLIYGDGLNAAQILAAMTFALDAVPMIHRLGPQAPVQGQPPPGFPDAWDSIRAEIDADRPILRKSHVHAVAIIGYGIYLGQRVIVINDPARGQVFEDIAALDLSSYVFFFSSPASRGVRQEVEVKIDTDGDGVVDFDETNRFHIDPRNLDTDKDGVPDKADIASGVYDYQYGYAVSWDPIGRDFDADGVSTELDRDSDSGGCYDGVEDANRSGHLDVPESWNFNPDDDVCREVNGHISFTAEFVGDLAIRTFRHERFSVSVALKPEKPGELGRLVDNGSTFRMQTVSQVEAPLDGGCTVISRGSWSGGGPFKPATDDVGGHADDLEMVVGAMAESPGSYWSDLCFTSGGDQTTDTASLPTCDGKRVSKTSRSYQFNCTTPPQPPPGYRILIYRVSGLVTLAPTQSLVERMTPILRNPHDQNTQAASVPSRLSVYDAGAGGRIRIVAR